MKFIFFISLLLLELSACPAHAAESDRSSAQFFDSIMSPYCPGMTLSACPSDDARILRNEIREKLEAGVSREKIESDLKVKFGNLTGEPSAGAMSGIAYLGILVFFAAGIGMIVFNIRNSQKVGDVETET